MTVQTKDLETIIELRVGWTFIQNREPFEMHCLGHKIPPGSFIILDEEGELEQMSPNRHRIGFTLRSDLEPILTSGTDSDKIPK